jgi:hypothetical protein
MIMRHCHNKAGQFVHAEFMKSRRGAVTRRSCFYTNGILVTAIIMLFGSMTGASHAEDEIVPYDPVLAGKLSRPVVTDDKGHIVSDTETGAESDSDNGDDEDINEETPYCIHHAPELSISPSGAQWTTPGTPIEFTVIVTNTSSTYCDPADFDLSASAPPGWDILLDNETLQIAPDWSTGLATMVVTSPDSADNGPRDITITARNERLSIASSATATCVIGEDSDGLPDVSQEPFSTDTPGVGMIATDPDEAGTGTTVNTGLAAQETCIPAAPNLIFSATGSDSSRNPTPMFTITLMNNDPPACTDSTFDLSITYLPPGWRGSLATRQLTLSPGKSGKTVLTVIPSSAVADSTYRLQVGVSDARSPDHTKTSVTSDERRDTRLSGTIPY